MIYRLDGKEIDITGKRLTKIGTGKTGDVYKYKNYALKIFRKDRKPPIDVYTARDLTTIPTEKILLPRQLLFGDQIFSGYTYKLVPKRGPGNRLITLPREGLVGNIEDLEQDTRRISIRRVLLNGIEPSNCIFNGNLYVSDPALYTILETFSIRELEALNKYQIHMLLTALLVSEIRKNSLGNSFEKTLKELFESKDIEEDTSAFLKRLLEPGESIKQFSKRI